MFSAVASFFDSKGFMPHGMCLLWRPDILWTHIVSDSLIALAYFSIPAAIIHFARRRQNFPYVWVLYLFGAFIVWCGITHLASIMTFWVPAYGVEAAAKVITAAVSMTTAIMLWPLMPKALRIPSIGELKAKNDELEREVVERLSVERRLQELTSSLERRVNSRTRELTEANAHLAQEILRRKQGEQELLRAIAAADAASNAKTVFLAGMSHELRSPLNAILGFAQMLEQVRPQGLDAQQREYLANIQTGGSLLLELIERLLDLSMFESGQTDIRVEATDVAACIEKARTILDPMARRAEVCLAIAKPTDGDIAALADPMRLLQIIVNLGSNAIKYNRPGGRVDIEARQASPDSVTIKFADTGIGIPAHLQPQVFQSFNRLNQNESGVQGAGLGLALSKRLAQAMGGDITFASVEGQGTEFTLTLKRAVKSAANMIGEVTTISTAARGG
jgi:signal transduction histidine kinase